MITYQEAREKAERLVPGVNMACRIGKHYVFCIAGKKRRFDQDVAISSENGRADSYAKIVISYPASEEVVPLDFQTGRRV